MQAQHNSLLDTPAARWQARAHDLSIEARCEAWASTLPMKALLGDMWVLLRGDAVCLSPSDTLDGVYEDHLPPGKHLSNLFRTHPEAGSLWTNMVESGAYSNQELNTLLWVRAAPWMHSAASTKVLCPFCRQPVPGWGAHLPSRCIKLVQALLHAFRAVASHLAAQGLDIRWRSVVRFTVSSLTIRPADVTLAGDEDFAADPRSHRGVTITWSGLWISREGADLDPHRNDVLHHFTRALTLAARGESWPLFEDVGDLGPSAAYFDAPWRVAARVQALVQAVGSGEWDTPSKQLRSSVGLRDGLPCGAPSSTFHRALWGPQPPCQVEGVAAWSFFKPTLRMHHPDYHLQFCGAGLVLRGPHQLLPSQFLSALTLINSAI